jgi:hypothetical protein
LSNFTDQALEWELADQELSRFLILSDLTESNSSWSESMWSLDATCNSTNAPGSLGGQLFSWGFPTTRDSCGLFGSCHDEYFLLSGEECCRFYRKIILQGASFTIGTLRRV